MKSQSYSVQIVCYSIKMSLPTWPRKPFTSPVLSPALCPETDREGHWRVREVAVVAREHRPGVRLAVLCPQVPFYLVCHLGLMAFSLTPAISHGENEDK